MKGRQLADKKLFEATPIPEESDEYNTLNSYNQKLNRSNEIGGFTGISRQDSTSQYGDNIIGYTNSALKNSDGSQRRLSYNKSISDNSSNDGNGTSTGGGNY